MIARMLQRPIYGGPFGQGIYALATLPTIANGLHAVRFMVVEPRRGNVLSVADDKQQAIAAARRVLVALPTHEPANDPAWEQARLWPDLPVDRPPPAPLKISRRRREVFERSDGKCFYCCAILAIDAFHVEHQQARALGGTDDPLNLVAACALCNRTKSDRTALEFIASGD